MECVLFLFRRLLAAADLDQIHNLPEAGPVRFLDHNLLTNIGFVLRQKNLSLLIAVLNRALLVLLHNHLPWQKRSPRRTSRRTFNPAQVSKSRSCDSFHSLEDIPAATDGARSFVGCTTWLATC